MAGLVPAIRSDTSLRQVADGGPAATNGSQLMSDAINPMGDVPYPDRRSHPTRNNRNPSALSHGMAVEACGVKRSTRFQNRLP